MDKDNKVRNIKQRRKN